MLPTKILRNLLLPIVCLALSAPAIEAQARDIAAIKASGKLIVSVPNLRTPPFFFEDKGELKGLDIDLAKSIAESLGVKVVFNRDGQTFNDAVQLVAEDKADMSAAKISRTLPRAQTVLFTEPYLVLPHALLVNRLRFAEIAHGRPVAQVLQEYSGSIGVIAKSAFADFARANFPKAKIVEFDKWETVVDAVSSGKVTVAYRDAFEAKRIFKVRPDLTITVRSVLIDDINDTIGIAVGATNYHFLTYLNLFMKQKGIKYTSDQILTKYENFLN